MKISLNKYNKFRTGNQIHFNTCTEYLSKVLDHPGAPREVGLRESSAQSVFISLKKFFK
jgi:hypothetical protein